LRRHREREIRLRIGLLVEDVVVDAQIRHGDRRVQQERADADADLGRIRSDIGLRPRVGGEQQTGKYDAGLLHRFPIASPD
jgi:hypothetical protein